jgi:hypothetical protein
MAFHEQVRSGDTATVGQRELDGFVERPSSVAAAHTERVRAAECAEIVALDVFNRPDRQPVTMSMVQAPGRRTTSASAVVPETGAALRRASTRATNVVRLAERREPLTAQAYTRIN